MLTNVNIVNVSQYVYQIATLYTLNLHSIISKLYLKKAQGKGDQ